MRSFTTMWCPSDTERKHFLVSRVKDVVSSIRKAPLKQSNKLLKRDSRFTTSEARMRDYSGCRLGHKGLKGYENIQVIVQPHAKAWKQAKSRDETLDQVMVVAVKTRYLCLFTCGYHRYKRSSREGRTSPFLSLPPWRCISSRNLHSLLS